MSRTAVLARLLALGVIAGAMACGIQYDPKSATFYQGKPGGMVMTPNGPVFRESADIPERVVFRDPDEPWRPPIGFILPKSGKFTQTSTATTIASNGIVIVLRSSDTRVPAWGGEVLVRLDIHATAADGTTRPGEKVAIILDDDSTAASDLLEIAVAQLGARDSIAIVDSHGARTLVPAMPATHRSLALATALHRLNAPRPKRDFSAALALAKTSLAGTGTRKLLVISQQLQTVALDGISGLTIDPKREDASGAVRAFLPNVGPITFKDLVIAFDGVPSPARVIEASGGEAIWTLEGSDLRLGDIRAGDARSEILRVSIPPWIPTKNFKLNVTAHALDASSGKTRWLTAEMNSVYDNDLERIAESRHGDVIAYASALATMHRLHAAFIGDGVDRVGGLLPLAKLQAKSLAALARDFPDRGFAEDAAVLNALLAAASLP